MKKIISGISGIAAVLFIGFFLFLGLKSMVVVFHNQENLQVFCDTLETGEIHTLFFTEDENIIHLKNFKQDFDYAVYNADGRKATHYFGPVYKLGKSVFDFRFFSDAKAVYRFKCEIIKTGGNLEESTFPEVGSVFRPVVAFKEDKVWLNGRYYMEVEAREEHLSFLSGLH